MQNKREYKGQILLWYGILYSIIRFLIEGMRTDSLMFFYFRISQILSVFILILSIAILFYKRGKEAESK